MPSLGSHSASYRRRAVRTDATGGFPVEREHFHAVLRFSRFDGVSEEEGDTSTRRERRGEGLRDARKRIFRNTVWLSRRQEDKKTTARRERGLSLLIWDDSSYFQFYLIFNLESPVNWSKKLLSRYGNMRFNEMSYCKITDEIIVTAVCNYFGASERNYTFH